MHTEELVPVHEIICSILMSTSYVVRCVLQSNVGQTWAVHESRKVGFSILSATESLVVIGEKRKLIA